MRIGGRVDHVDRLGTRNSKSQRLFHDRYCLPLTAATTTDEATFPIRTLRGKEGGGWQRKKNKDNRKGHDVKKWHRKTALVDVVIASSPRYATHKISSRFTRLRRGHRMSREQSERGKDEERPARSNNHHHTIKRKYKGRDFYFFILKKKSNENL